jgi:prepilin-type N-terminal cleavage/methylation domain-containing protein
MKNLKKKGFTIVELVIVIAVIAVLAAVLIPTFVNLTKKANLSADQQAVRQMNVALATTEADTIDEAVAALDEAGYNALDTLTPVSTGYSFWWVEEYNSIVLLNENAEVVFASNKDAQANFEAAKEAGKAFNLKRGLAKVDATNV